MNTLIVAMDEDHLIGRGLEIPWRLPEDMKLFRQRTMGQTLIMGRTTWQTLPKFDERPYLDGRVNFVVTRKPADWQARVAANVANPEGPHFVDTIELAISRARREFPEFVQEIFILGGRQIYELALRRNLVDRMIISHVHGKHIGDVRFPEFSGEWIGRDLEQFDDFHVVEYVRRP